MFYSVVRVKKEGEPSASISFIHSTLIFAPQEKTKEDTRLGGDTVTALEPALEPVLRASSVVGLPCELLGAS